MSHLQAVRPDVIIGEVEEGEGGGGGQTPGELLQQVPAQVQPHQALQLAHIYYQRLTNQGCRGRHISVVPLLFPNIRFFPRPNFRKIEKLGSLWLIQTLEIGPNVWELMKGRGVEKVTK